MTRAQSRLGVSSAAASRLALGLALGLVFGLALGLAPAGQAQAQDAQAAQTRPGPQITVALQAPQAGRDLQARLRAASLLWTEFRDSPETASGSDLAAAALADYARLLSALYEAGHYGGVISITVGGIEATALPPRYRLGAQTPVVISVDPGPEFVFALTQISPQAANATGRTAGDTDLPPDFAPGQVARAGAMRDAVAAALEGWRAAGHPLAAPAGQDIVADHPARTVSARFALDPGPAAVFGPVTVAGAERMRVERILFLASITGGADFSPETLAEAAQRLRRTGVFRAVTISEADSLGPDGSLATTITVTEADLRRYGFGAEFSSTDGVRLGGYWLHRNLLGGGERLRLDFGIEGIGGTGSGTDYRAGATYTRPGTFLPDGDLTLSLFWQDSDSPSFSRQAYGGGVRYDYRFNERLSGSGGLALSRETVADANGTRDLSLISLPLSLTLDRRDNAQNPTSGFYLGRTLTPFAELSSGQTGAQARLDARAYLALDAEQRFVLAGRVQSGMLFGPQMTDAPPDLLFYSGGGGTVRGLPFQALGIDHGGGLITGGRSFLGASIELRAQLWDSIGLVGFADAGQVGENPWPDGSGDWHAGAGIGLRYDTGIGLLRVDLATPVFNGAGAPGLSVYVGLGQAF